MSERSAVQNPMIKYTQPKQSYIPISPRSSPAAFSPSAATA
jgi:hypothetical protein